MDCSFFFLQIYFWLFRDRKKVQYINIVHLVRLYIYIIYANGKQKREKKTNNTHNEFTTIGIEENWPTIQYNRKQNKWKIKNSAYQTQNFLLSEWMQSVWHQNFCYPTNTRFVFFFFNFHSYWFLTIFLVFLLRWMQEFIECYVYLNCVYSMLSYLICCWCCYIHLF